MNSYTYTPFGEPLTGEGSGYRFNGEYYDSATGMVNLRARQYEPSVMRFVQRDIWHGAQIIATTHNRYLYCINDPINLFDFNGEAITSKFAGPRLPISKPLVDIAKDNPGLKKSVVDSIKKLSASVSTGIDTTGYNETQRKVVEEAERKLLEETINGTLTEEKRKSIIHAACYESFWAGGDDYFDARWWQDKTKLSKAAGMLQLEAENQGKLSGYSLGYQKMLALQALAGVDRSGVYDEHTQEYLSGILNIDAYNTESAYSNYTPEQISYLIKRNQNGIAGTGYGNFMDNGGKYILAGLAILFSAWLFENIGFEEPVIDGQAVNKESVDGFIENNVNENFQQSVRSAFSSDAQVTTLSEDRIVYRYHGGGSTGKSYWYTPYQTFDPASDLALPPGNTYQFMDTYVIPKGTTILEGSVAPNFGQPGGGYQIFVSDPTIVISY